MSCVGKDTTRVGGERGGKNSPPSEFASLLSELEKRNSMEKPAYLKAYLEKQGLYVFDDVALLRVQNTIEIYLKSGYIIFIEENKGIKYTVSHALFHFSPSL